MSGALTLATWLTIGRIVLIVPFAVFAITGPGWLAALVFLAAGLTDWLDGYVARSRGQVSALGATLDPVADKMLTAAALLVFTASGAIYDWHLVAALAIALREALVGGLRESVASDGIKLPVTQLAKWKTTVQFAAFFVLCFAPYSASMTTAGLVLLWIAAAMTVITGYRYAEKAVTALTRSSVG